MTPGTYSTVINLYITVSFTSFVQPSIDEWDRSGCPQGCACQDVISNALLYQMLHTIDCRSKLRAVPVYVHPQDASHLTYSPNLAKQVIFPDFTGDLNSVQQLMLSSNDIGLIPPRAFINLSSLLSLDLSDNSLTELRQNDLEGLRSLTSLNLTLNHLRVIKMGAFKHVPDLLNLYLTKNSLRTLEHSLFVGIKRLEQLFLAENKINSVENNTFSELKQLRTLSLAKNLISSLVKTTFKGLDQLEHLDLSENQLFTIPSRVIAVLNNLRDLKLDGNPVQSIGAFAFDSLNLYALSLNDMQKLTVIESNAFLSLTSLSKLEISRNPKLVYISPEAINDVPHLSTLQLSDNNLKAIPGILIMSLPGLRQLYVHGNPLLCDCNVKWMRKILEEQGNGMSNGNSEAREDDALASPVAEMFTIKRASDILCSSVTDIRPQPLKLVPLESIPDKCSPVVTPLFDKQYNMEIGSSLILECKGIGIPTPTIHWILASGKELTSNNIRMQIKNSNTLVIDHIKTIDSGTYTCSVHNPEGYSSASTVLKVHSKNIHLMYKGVATNFITVTWNNSDSTVSTTDYVILYRRYGFNERYHQVPIHPYMRAYTFTQLSPQTKYEFCIAYVKDKTPKKLNCIRVTTKHSLYATTGIKSIHNASVIVTICVVVAAITVICIMTAVCKNYCKHRNYKDPSNPRDRYYSMGFLSNKDINHMSHIPLEDLYTAPSTPIPSTPLCTSTTSLISPSKT